MPTTSIQVASRLRSITIRSFPLLLLCATIALSLCSPAKLRAAAASTGTTILQAEDVTKLVPATVFFRGQVASVQARNAGGVKMPDGMLVLCALVDTSGYSTAVQQKYQAYFITETPLTIGGQVLKPGAYGVGFVADNKFLVMDLGAHDLFTTPSTHDAELKGPRPLQILADTATGQFRLYINRSYIVFSRATGQ